MPSIFALMLLNLFLLCFYLTYLNRVDTVPYAKMLLMTGVFSIVVSGLWIVTGFSIDSFMSAWVLIWQHTIVNWYIYFFVVMSLFLVLVLPILLVESKKLLLPQNQKYLAVGATFVVVASVIWLRHGFDNVGHLEIWTTRSFLAFGPPDKIANEMVTRLSARIPFTLAHLINPDGLQGHYIIHYLVFPCKGLLLFAVLKKFKINDPLAFVIALLAMLYPSETEIMSVRTHAHAFRVNLFLLTIYMFILYVQNPNRGRLIAFFVCMYLIVTSGEYPYLLLLGFPVLLINFTGRKVSLFINLSIIWYILPFAYGIYFLLNAYYFEPYGTQLISANILQEIPEILSALLASLYHLLLEGWVEIFSVSNTFGNIILVIVVSLLVYCVAYYKLSTIYHKHLFQSLLYIVFGIGIIILATTVFSIFPSDRFDNRQIYMYGSLGAAIVVGSSLYFATHIISSQRYHIITFLTCSTILIGVAFNYSLLKYDQYWQSAKQKSQFLQFTDDIVLLSSEATWVFLTHMPEQVFIEKLGQLHNERVRNKAIQFMMGDIALENSHVCFLESNNCIFHTTRLRQVPSSPYLADRSTPYDEIVFFWLEKDLTVELLTTLPDEPWQLSYAEDAYQGERYIQPDTK